MHLLNTLLRSHAPMLCDEVNVPVHVNVYQYLSIPLYRVVRGNGTIFALVYVSIQSYIYLDSNNEDITAAIRNYYTTQMKTNLIN